MARRKHLPADWEQIARRRVAYWNVLSSSEQSTLAELAAHLVENKRWEAARGFTMTDEVL